MNPISVANRKERHLYGNLHPDQHYELNFPSNVSDLHPVLVLIHGGFWKAKYTKDNSCIDSLIPFYLDQNFVVCNLEYRRVGHGGGWPHTNSDIIEGLTHLYDYAVSSAEMDEKRIVLLGHSAGGTLALWSISDSTSSNEVEAGLSNDLPFVPKLCIALAPIGNLIAGYERRLSDEGDAIPKYMQGHTPDTALSLYRQASPHLRLPFKTKCVVVSGTMDIDVPYDLVASFVKDCQETATCLELLTLESVDHYNVVDGSSEVRWTILSKILQSI